MLPLPRLRWVLARELKDGLAVEVVLGLEVFEVVQAQPSM
jgi:hypothetical protein